MKWHFVWVLTGLITLGASFCVEALAIVESRTGEPIVYDAAESLPSSLPIARSSEDRAVSSRVTAKAPAEDRAALLSLKHLETLKQEISELRGLVETQEHEIQQLKKSQQDLYTDLDKRMMQLQPTKGNSVAKTASKTLVVVSPTATATAKKSSVTIVPTGRTPVSALPIDEEKIEETTAEPMASDFSESTAVMNKKSGADQATEKGAYEAAYNLVRTKRYTEATSAFQNYLARFKTGEHAANAHYWVGEIYMVEWQKNPTNKTLLDKAAHAFSNIGSQFPGNPKVPDALLKLGIIENEKGDPIAARKYFTDVKSRYPGSAAARIAETRLKQL